MFFFPDTRLVATPADGGYAYEDIGIETRDGLTLHAWLIEPAGKARGTVHFLHGNAENVSTHARAAVWLVNAGYRVLALDYRGYGKSEGTPDIPEVFEDIRASSEWLFAHVESIGDEAPLYVFAQSLGASLAIRQLELEPAQRSRYSALIVEAPFTRYGAVARHVARRSALTWAFAWAAPLFLRGPDDPLDAVPALAPLPILFVHSEDDTIVPFRFGVALHEAAGEPKAFLPVTGPHIAAVREEGTREAMLAFMRAHAAPPRIDPAEPPPDRPPPDRPPAEPLD